MAENELQADAGGLEELRDEMKVWGWAESAGYIASCIELVTDLCAARLIPLGEIQNFRESTRIMIKSLMDLEHGPHDEEVGRLREALRELSQAFNSRRSKPLVDQTVEKWSVSEALDWRNHVEHARQFCEDCCYSWRIHLNGLPADQLSAALQCVEEIERRIPLLRSGRLAEMRSQYEEIEKCMILNGELMSYLGHTPIFAEFADTIVHDRKKWAALFEALIDSRWLDSSSPRLYLTRVATTIYRRDVRPDVGGLDSLGVEHRSGPGGKIKQSDVMRQDRVSLEEIPESLGGPNFERQLSEHSVTALRKEAAKDSCLKEYVDAIIRHPKWKRSNIWKALAWSQEKGKAVGRKYRRVRQRLKNEGSGMDWREAPTPGTSPSATTYFETLFDGKRGKEFGVWQHKLLKTGDK